MSMVSVAGPAYRGLQGEEGLNEEEVKHYSGTFPQGHFPGNFPPNGMMANNVPMTHFSPEAFSQEFSLEQPTLRALPALM